jgi:condensin complex subunit 1
LLAVQNYVGFLEKKAEQYKDLDVEEDEKAKLLSTNKILAYAISSILCIIEDQIADNNNNVEYVGKVNSFVFK